MIMTRTFWMVTAIVVALASMVVAVRSRSECARSLQSDPIVVMEPPALAQPPGGAFRRIQWFAVTTITTTRDKRKIYPEGRWETQGACKGTSEMVDVELEALHAELRDPAVIFSDCYPELIE